MKKIDEKNKTLTIRLRRLLVLCAVGAFLISTQLTYAATFVVTNNADSGTGSLRDAINMANASAGPHTIGFTGFSGTITPLSPLPIITSSDVTIDGYTAISASTNGGGVGDALTTNLTVELNGASAGSSGIGLQISGANCTIQGLVINRFQNAGIRINPTAAGTRIFGNFIGTNPAGNAALGNFNRGILIVGATDVIIGSQMVANSQRNLISGNSGEGISITGGGSAIIKKNLIGTARDGTTDLGNTQNGIQIVDSSNSQIGVILDTRNIISGNNGTGITVIRSSSTTTASGNLIKGNYIGVSRTTTQQPLPNNGSGISIQASGNTIGGNTANEANVISSNSSNGISISTSLATGNTVAGNFIGTTSNGTTARGNTQSGIRISGLANGNIIGGTDVTPGICNNSCNIIANNGAATSIEARAGIYVDTTGGARNTIRGNSIFNNGAVGTFNGLGIDLGTPNTTANDALDADTGANNLQNFPVLTTANTAGQVVGTINTTSNTAIGLDFYRNSTTDALASEGRIYVGSLNVTTDGSGNANFTFASTAALSLGEFITATATTLTTAFAPQAIGDTSEFSAPQQVLAATAASVTFSGRVLSSGGNPITDAFVTLTDSRGNVLGTRANSFGYYSFVEVNAGETYIITATARKYSFTPQILFINNSITNFNLYPDK